MNELRGLWSGKRVDNGEWVLGCLIRSGSKAMIFVLDDKTNRISGTDVDPSTIGECTCLRDKNGKLIFEGDIVKHYCYKDDATKFDVGVVFWEEKHARFKRTSNNDDTYFLDNNSMYPYVVIGNIHDNPELLKCDTGEDIGNAAQDTLAPAT